MRYHIEVSLKGRVVNIVGGFPDESSAIAGKTEREKQQVTDNEEAVDQYVEALKASIFDRGDSDLEPRHPVRFNYTYQVTPCTYDDRCAACIEAGVVTPPP